MAVWSILKTASAQWLANRSQVMGAALAYYSVFSLGPLLLIVTGIAGLFFGDDSVKRGLVGQLHGLLGDAGSKAIEALLDGTSSVRSGRLTAIVGVILLLVASLSVVVQLKGALNQIWNVEQPKGLGVWWYVRTYMISLVGVLALGFLLAVSLVLSAGFAALSSRIGSNITIAGELINLVTTLLALTILFAMLFKWVPDTRIEWGDVIPGAVVTALLFEIGKFVIGWYIATQGLESTYGAAASIVVLLVWVYYSAQILLFGSELTHAYALEQGSLRKR